MTGSWQRTLVRRGWSGEGGEAIRETVTQLGSDNSTIHLHFTITGDSARGNCNAKRNCGLIHCIKKKICNLNYHTKLPQVKDWYCGQKDTRQSLIFADSSDFTIHLYISLYISTDPAEAINNFNCVLCRNAECIFGQFWNNLLLFHTFTHFLSNPPFKRFASS